MLRLVAIIEAVWSIIVGGYLLLRPGSPPVPINTIIGIVAIVLGVVGAGIAVLSPTLPLPPPRSTSTS